MRHAETVEFEDDLPVADWPLQLARRSPAEPEPEAEADGPQWYSRQGPVIGVALTVIALALASILWSGDPVEDAQPEADAGATIQCTADGADPKSFIAGVCDTGTQTLFTADAGTNLARLNETVDSNTTKVDLELPRRFTTWQGEIHNCVLVAPCELRFRVQDHVLNEDNTPVRFAEESILRNVLLAETSAPGPDLDGEEISVQINGLTRYNSIECVIDRVASCGETTSPVITTSRPLRVNIGRGDAGAESHHRHSTRRA